MDRRTPLLLLPFLAALSCSKPPELKGKVVDVWGAPIPGANVQLEGVPDGTQTGAIGGFTFENVPAGKRRVMADMEGYIKEVTEIEIPAEATEETMPSPKIELFLDPGKPGFFLVGKDKVEPEGYHHLEAVKVETVGTELGGLNGLPKEGTAHVPAGLPARFVFSSTLRASQLSQMNLQLHQLEFIAEKEVTGVLGDTAVKVNLWVAKDVVEFDLKGLSSEDDYLITTREKLKPGIYAFHTEDVLTADDKDALDKMPKEMRVAYPFEVK